MSAPSFVSNVDPLVRPGSLFASENRLHASVVLTLLLLLLYAHRYWYVDLPLSIIAIAALIFPSLSHSRLTWGAVTLIVALASAEHWWALDNHKYLLGYWCVALLCAFHAPSPDRCAAKSARWLVGLVFGLAVVQKTISSDFLDGSFIHYQLLLDERFGWLARHMGGVPDHASELNFAARRALVSFDSDLMAVTLQGGPNLFLLAPLVTAWTYGIELVIAVAFLSPRPRWLHGRRDALLLTFLATTYVFAPVVGFGWVLAIMGIAQTADESTRARLGYVVAFLLLQAYRIPWSEAWNAGAGLLLGDGA